MQSHTEGLLCPRGCDSQSGGFADVSSFQSSPRAQVIFVPFAQRRRWRQRGLRKRSTSHTSVRKAQSQVKGGRWDSRPHTEHSATRLSYVCSEYVWPVLLSPWTKGYESCVVLHVTWVQSTLCIHDRWGRKQPFRWSQKCKSEAYAALP